jgi:hypothetical protein
MGFESELGVDGSLERGDFMIGDCGEFSGIGKDVENGFGFENRQAIGWVKAAEGISGKKREMEVFKAVSIFSAG